MYRKTMTLMLILIVAHVVSGEIVQLRGTGASFPAEVYKNWMPAFSASRQQHKTVNMTYLSVGSGNGQKAIKKNIDTEYAGSDSLLSSDDQTNYPDLVMLPIMAGAVVIAYNLPDLQGRMRLTREHIVGIYNGTIQYWNDTAIRESNPSLIMPNARIIVVARGDKSGTTNLFTKALSAFDEGWKNEYGEFSEGYDYANHKPFHWKNSVITYFGQQNRGSSGLILSFENSIGYLSLADAIEANLKFATIRNKAGLYLNAEYTAVQSAMDYHSQFTNSFTFDLVDSASPSSYPMSGFTYFIFYKTAMSNCESAKELVRYIEWIYTEQNADNICQLLGFAPVSDKVANRVTSNILQKVTCNGLNVWNMMLEDKRRENQNHKSNEWIIPVSVTGPLLGITVLCMMAYILLQRIKLKRRISNNEWSIDIEDVTFYYDPKINSEKTYQTLAWSCRSLCPVDDIKDGNDVVNQILQWPGKWKGHVVGLSLVKIDNFKIVSWETKRTMLQMRDSMIHSNVQRFFGLTELEGDRYVLGEYCSKGTLQKVLHDGRYNLTKDFKSSIASDITNGMNFLHNQGIIHGVFNSNCCLIDYRWTVKISSWEYFKLFKAQEPNKNPYERLKVMARDQHTAFDSFWVAPEILRADFRIEPTHAADVYSYAIVLQEIFTRQLPYWEHSDVTTPDDIIKAVVNNHLRPQLGADIPITMRQIMDIAWSENAYSRPSFEQITKMIKSSANTGKSVLDSMIDAMDEYTHHLEDRIVEQSTELKLMKKTLTNQSGGFIPKSYLKRMVEGEDIQPNEHPFLFIAVVKIADASSILGTFSAVEIFELFNQYYNLLNKVCDMYGGFRVSMSDLGDDVIVFGLGQSSSEQSILQLGHFCVDIHSVIGNDMCNFLPSSLQRLALKVVGHVGFCKTGIIGSQKKTFVVVGQAVNVAQILVSFCDNHSSLVSKATADMMERSKAFIMTEVPQRQCPDGPLFRLLGRTGINVIGGKLSEDEGDNDISSTSLIESIDNEENSVLEKLRSKSPLRSGGTAIAKTIGKNSSSSYLTVPRRKFSSINKVHPV